MLKSKVFNIEMLKEFKTLLLSVFFTPRHDKKIWLDF